MALGDRSSQSNAKDLALDVASSKHGFIVRIGPVFLSLDRHAAEELMYLLAEALEVGDPLGIGCGSN
jgi:hypothetical protein